VESSPYNTNSSNFHPTLQEISFSFATEMYSATTLHWYYLPELSVTSTAFEILTYNFEYFSTTLRSLHEHHSLREHSLNLLCIYYVLRLLLQHDPPKTSHPQASFRRLRCYFNCTMSSLPSTNCCNATFIHVH
jgi:hypothetical protein